MFVYIFNTLSPFKLVKIFEKIVKIMKILLF